MLSINADIGTTRTDIVSNIMKCGFEISNMIEWRFETMEVRVKKKFKRIRIQSQTPRLLVIYINDNFCFS